MARVRGLDPDSLLAAVRACFVYPPGEKRATGYLDEPWLAPLLKKFGADHVVFQAYADGTATCDRHVDLMPQVIVSLGATRTFGLAGETFELAHGDVIDVPLGTPHCVFPDPEVADERVSLVFRSLEVPCV